MKNKVPFKEAALYWLKLGFISFGGPASQVSMMHEEVVERKKWIDDKSFFHALNFTMLLPGPEAQQLATYLGWLMHGRIGGFTAGILFIIPSFFSPSSSPHSSYYSSTTSSTAPRADTDV